MLCCADSVQYHHAELIANLMKALGPLKHKKCNDACLPHFIMVAHSNLFKMNQVSFKTLESIVVISAFILT